MSGRIAQSTLDTVKERADLVELAAARTDMVRRGAEFTGRCPFHEERTPSFWVNPVKKTYYCFGCQKKGGVLDFVMESQALTLPEAVEWLAARYGVEVERERSSPAEDERRRREARQRELLELAATYYVRVLRESPAAEGARAYLTSRGISDETAERFQLGYAPAEWDRVVTAAQKRGFGEEELTATGLARRARGGQGSLIDLFRGRLIFPLADIRGRVVAFGARRLPPEEEGPKYLNSPDGPLWHKGDVLYGLHLAKDAVARANEAIVVEGYTDVIALAQAGVPNAVASMGTALTDRQVRDLRRLTSNAVLCFDADAAGSNAALRGMELAERAGLAVRVATPPPGRDPADLAAEGTEAVQSVLDGARGVLAFRVGAVLSAADLGSARGIDEAHAAVRDVLGSAPPSAERRELARQVATALRLTDDDVARLSGSQGPSRTPLHGRSADSGTKRTITPVEREFLLLAVTSRGGDEALSALEAVGEDDFAVAEHRQLREMILRRLRNEPPAEGDDALALEYEPALDAWAAREAGDAAVLRELSSLVRAHALEARMEPLKRKLTSSDISRDERLELQHAYAQAEDELRDLRQTAMRTPS